MKKLIIAVVFALTGVGSVNAQVEDQLALKRLVDTFSILADVKDVKGQLELFTDDAEVISK
ncbi:MAG: nuclear transport factor 2 family protein, partial [Prevotella sp.]|nr:nuclear transport factor 2 family protein [Prevotella sp.]